MNIFKKKKLFTEDFNPIEGLEVSSKKLPTPKETVEIAVKIYGRGYNSIDVLSSPITDPKDKFGGSETLRELYDWFCDGEERTFSFKHANGLVVFDRDSISKMEFYAQRKGIR